MLSFDFLVPLTGISHALLHEGACPLVVTPEAKAWGNPSPYTPGSDPVSGDKVREHYGAADRNRTGTGVAPRGILSPLRLPIPPQRHTLLDIRIIMETARVVKRNIVGCREAGRTGEGAGDPAPVVRERGVYSIDIAVTGQLSIAC